ncbi:mnd1 family protein [Cystoisospora suis]|uniref:Mnd1 family protein n=1 Tax=Cystoisospora suis TaxID=483139 RepID=A0A2C6L2Z5_9APIC|nr:mnd1 family protein [Cystoisospora suis]
MAKSKQTAEERLRKFHELVLDSQSFFGAKELEKLAEKAGYRAIQAKDAVKMLLDENLINTDKIGASSVFWALKSEATARRVMTLQKLRYGMVSAIQMSTVSKQAFGPNHRIA